MLATILALTLYPTPSAAPIAANTPLLCLVCGENGGTDVILNLLLFAPLAAALRLSGWSWRRTVVSCFLLSFTVELCQYLFVPGRDASLSDVLTNTGGGSVAAAVAPLIRSALTPARRDAQRLLWLGVALWVGLCAFGAWGFQPWVKAGRGLSEWPDLTKDAGAFEGTLSSVAVAGTVMPRGRLDRSEVARIVDLMARNALEVRLAGISAAPPPRREWIYRLRVGKVHLAVTQRGTTLGWEVPRRLGFLRLNHPRLHLPGGAPARQGVPFTISAGERGQHLWLETTSEGRARRADLVLTPTMVWGLVIPFDYGFGPEARLLAMLWVAGLMAPLGFWGAHAERPAAAIAILAAAIALGLGVIPWLSQTGPIPPREWLAAAAGVAAGWAARAPAAYLASRCGSPSASESFSS